MMKKKNRIRRFVPLFLSIVFVMTLSLPAFASEAESFECQNGNDIVVDEFRAISFDDYVNPEVVPDGVYTYSGDADGQTEIQMEANGETAVFWSSPEEVDEFQITHVSEEITPRGVVYTFHFSIPGNGVYYELINFRGIYEAGSTVKVWGSWSPSYAGISVRLADMTYGGSTEIHNILPGVTKNFELWKHSTWGLYVRSSGLGVSGNLQVTVT